MDFLNFTKKNSYSLLRVEIYFTGLAGFAGFAGLAGLAGPAGSGLV